MCGLSLGRGGQSHTVAILREYEMWHDNGYKFWDWDHIRWWELECLETFQHDIPFDAIAKRLKERRGSINDPFRFRRIRIDSDHDSEIYRFLYRQFRGPQTIHGSWMRVCDLAGTLITDSARDGDSVRRSDLVDRLLLGIQQQHIRITPEYGDDWKTHLKRLNAEPRWRETDDSALAAALALCYYDHAEAGFSPWGTFHII
jgi:hypothetical protein